MKLAKITSAAKASQKTSARYCAGGSLLISLLMSALCYSEVEVSESWVRESIPGTSSSALFATLKNTGNKDAVLVSVAVQGADKTELHTTQDEDGMMRMRRLEQVVIPAGQTVQLAPGSYHVMLFRLASPLHADQKVAAEFRFSSGEKVATTAEVRSARDAEHHHHQH